MTVYDDTYYVSEIFESIQGEGNYAGMFCLFIRFHFCNLTCNWCDTKYTWWENSGPYKKFTRDQLIERIKNSKAHHIVFTGGEPTLFRLDLLWVEGKKFHVETNGTLIPTEKVELQLIDGTSLSRDEMDTDVVKNFNWVVSPKLKNSHQQKAISQAEQQKYLKYWAEKKWGIFKFIIKEANDLKEIDEIVKQFNIDKQMIFIGIEGQSLQSQIQPALVEEIIKYEFNFSPRLHVMLWGAKRAK